MPAPRRTTTQPEIRATAERLAAGPIAGLIREEARRISDQLPNWWEDNPWGEWTPENPDLVDPIDRERVVEAALAETIAVAVREGVARRLMLQPPTRPKTRSAVHELLGTLTGTGRIGVLGRLRLLERRAGDPDFD